MMFDPNEFDVEGCDEFLQGIINAGPDFPLLSEPKLDILIQPKQKGYRFRYSSEGNTHGGIPGNDSSRGNKTSPTIQIQNYSGKAAICINLVSANDPSKLHAHNLVGKNVQTGMYYGEFDKKEWVLPIANLGIQHVTKKDLVKVLYDKLLQGYQLNLFAKNDQSTQSFDIASLIDSFGPPEASQTNIDEAFSRIIEDEQLTKLKKEAEELSKTIDLSAVRLLIQAFLPDEKGNFTRAIPPVVSDPIFDAKAAHAGQLRICRLSKTSSSVAGNEEVFLLCDKVQKDDIAVRFYQNNGAGKVQWQDYGLFTSADVHKQTAIVFRTPPYEDRTIQKPVTVQVQLQRKKDGDYSDPCDFVYRPQEFDRYKIGEKRRKDLPDSLDVMLKSREKQQCSDTASRASSSRHSSDHCSGIKFFKP